MRHNQKGMGIAEVMISLTLLSFGVLGFVGVQLKATQNSMDSLTKLKSSIIALDFTEKIRSNPQAIDAYFTAMKTTSNQASGANLNCSTQFCTPSNKAKADVYQSYVNANKSGITMGLEDCPNTTARKCLFLAWGKTQPSSSGDSSCVVNTSSSGAAAQSSYRTGATCLMQEMIQ